MFEQVKDDLIALASHAPDLRGYCGVLIERAGRLAPYDSAIFLPEAVERTPVTANKTGSYAPIYAAYRRDQRLFAQELARGHRVGVRDGAYVDTEVYSLAERSVLRFFNEIVRPQGISTRLITVVAFRGRMLGTLQLCRHGRTKSFAAHEVEALRRLAPLVGMACSAVETHAADRASPATRAADDGELTERERELARLVTAGYQNKEIATLVHSSPNTVRNQLAGIFRKLRVANRAALAGRIARKTDRDPTSDAP